MGLTFQVAQFAQNLRYTRITGASLTKIIHAAINIDT
jgi:hypothetical protein